MDYQIFDKVNLILSYLEDEESKMIFLQRFLYNMSGNIHNIFDIIKFSNYFDVNEVPEKYQEIQNKYDIYPEMDMLSFIKDNSKSHNKIIIFGCGAIGNDVYHLINNAGISIECFCDNHKAGDMFLDRKIISTTELLNKHSDARIIIATMSFQDEIYNQLLDLGFEDENIYRPTPNMFISFFGEPYFDKSIFQVTENDIFIDGGCYGVETSIDFINWCPTYKKIYAFEPDNENYNKCRRVIEKNSIRDIELFHAGLWSSNTNLNFTHLGDNGTGSCIENQGEQIIHVLSIDEVLNGSEATFIKLDIEGAELEALKGAKDTICKYRPKMAICIYHKPQDIFEIPLYIKSLVNEYKFSIRHYSTYLYDTVLYCWV